MKLKVLIIDDDPDLLEMTSRRVAKKGYETYSALTLPEAQTILATNTDVIGIICDLYLSQGENGLDYFESEIVGKKALKFILMTGDDMADERIELLEKREPNFKCLQKPYSIDEVADFLKA